MLLLFGCSGIQTKDKEYAKEVLSDACYHDFADAGVNYSYMCYSPIGTIDSKDKCFFAVANHKNGSQACGYAKYTAYVDNLCTEVFIDDCSKVSSETIRAAAINQCESAKRTVTVTNPNEWEPCRIFANGMEIVWGKNGNEKSNFE